MRRAAIIGAGFGGLALAIRLQSAGIATTIVEADMSTAPTAGLRLKPAQASTPAASGIAKML